LYLGVRVAYRKLIASFLALLIISTHANAGFSSMRPPPGYSKSSSGATQQPGWGPSYKPAPGEFYDLGKQKWMTSASLNTGGRDLVVPVAMPLATAGTVALAVAAAFSSNPAILLGTAAWALYQAYLSQKEITPYPDGTFTLTTKVIDEPTGTYSLGGSPTFTTKSQLFNWIESSSQSDQFPEWYREGCYEVNGSIRCMQRHPGNPGNDFLSNIGPFTQVTNPPTESVRISTLTPQEVATLISVLPMSKSLVDALPIPLPVNPPVINPDSSTGAPKVLRLPQGSPSPLPLPSPNPDNLPQQWRTPVVDVIPSPTADDPWRVEVIPKDIIKTSSAPIPDPLNPVDPASPLPTPVTPVDTSPDTTEQARPPGLCDEYPDILACAKPELDTPATPELETRPRELTYTPDAGWGSGGACPAARHLPGANVDFEFTLVCDFMTGIKPVLLTVASLIAGMIIIGARGGAAE
jgi:hypothetical protein